ncbi:2,5-diamino-6-(ribosylamino)-4(3H)-pyrimidinone 5'-phosphate reductase [Methanohalophilus levihalophilus]|uniref:RibD family protein n=1 Tax=Methanohalophilus levihalophilus TaxID=1431282 RepID=UPI001AE70A05|nr:RibD family protein [Methanohalophilus levihalophilus]MBP2031181.1 2,5-diamino-6-(ribosylamino)-4(3H)-pyrimidinone 5'-phosphate reductase [Methanohalophilus levihalophilus]
MTIIPRVIMHNTISLDGAVIGFEVDMELHYQIAGVYGADAHLIGSTTAKTGIEMFGGEVGEEEPSDFAKPETTPDDPRAIWVIVDSQGILINRLHVLRKSVFCKDVLILVSSSTPNDYITYLKERNYEFIVSGGQHVKLESALEVLHDEYGINKVLVDTGPTLNGVLLGEGLVDELSLLIAPVLADSDYPHLFSKLGIEEGIDLELANCDNVGNGYVHLVYKIKK